MSGLDEVDDMVDAHLGLYLWTGWTGRALSRGNAEARDVHRFAAAAAIGASFLSAIAGFTLLP